MKINDFMLAQINDVTNNIAMTAETYAERNPTSDNSEWVSLGHPHILHVVEEEYDFTVVEDSGHGWFFLFRGETLVDRAPAGSHTIITPDVAVIDTQYYGTQKWMYFSASYQPGKSGEDMWEDMQSKEGHDPRGVMQFISLLEHGGNWLGTARRWMQSRAFNGDSVHWASQDFLKLRELTVSDIELLAAEIAASTINEMNAKIQHKGIIGYISEAKVRDLVKSKRRHAAIAALYQQAVNQIEDYFEYSNESARDKSRVMSAIKELTRGLKKLTK